MKIFIQLLLLILITSSCSKSGGSDDIEVIVPPVSVDNSVIKNLKEKYKNIIPNIDKYTSGSIYSKNESDTIILAFNDDSKIDVFFLNKKNEIISTNTTDLKNKELKVGLIFLPRKYLILDAFSIGFIPKSATDYYSTDTKLFKVYKKKDSDLSELKSFTSSEEYQKWDNINYQKSGQYYYHETNNVLTFVDYLTLKDIKTYQYWNTWTYSNANDYLIYNDATDIIKIKSSSYKGYYIIESSKIGLNNGVVVKNWEHLNAIYIPSITLKTGEVQKIDKTIKIDGSTLIADFKIFTKLWDGNNNLVEKTENKTYKFNLSTGVQI